MIQGRAYLKRLIKQGKAEFCGETESGSIVNYNNVKYVAVNRIDKQRVDHYEKGDQK